MKNHEFILLLLEVIILSLKSLYNYIDFKKVKKHKNQLPVNTNSTLTIHNLSVNVVENNHYHIIYDNQSINDK